MDQVVIGLYALLMVVVGRYVVRFQSRSGRIVPERKPCSLVGGWPELLYVRLQRVDVHGRGGSGLSGGNSSHGVIYWLSPRPRHAGGCAKRRQRRSRGIHPGLTRKEAARPSIDEVFPSVELCLAMVKTAGENAGRLLSAKN